MRAVLLLSLWLPLSAAAPVYESSHHQFVVISDQDQASKIGDNTWYSTLLTGTLSIEKGQSATVQWSWNRTYTSSEHDKSGRGMELSDLKVYNGMLLTPDDRTGIVYKLSGSNVAKWAYMPNGDGSDPASPFKCEWMTVKDGQLYCGGNGMEYVNPDQTIGHGNYRFVKIINSEGVVRSVNWTYEFDAVRGAYDLHFPGYMTHEAAQWSDAKQRWFFLPRKVSTKIFEEKGDMHAGSNLLISVSDCFCDFQVTTVGDAIPDRGFSAFQFVPNTDDELIVALKTREVDDDPMTTWIMVFDIDGRVLLPETPLPIDEKFEGLEFFNWTQFERAR